MIINNQKNAKEDISKFIINKNQLKKKQSFLKMKEILPYLLKKKIKIINNFVYNKKYLKINTNFLNSLIKNLYYTNILEQYSKILINSNIKKKV